MATETVSGFLHHSQYCLSVSSVLWLLVMSFNFMKVLLYLFSPTSDSSTFNYSHYIPTISIFLQWINYRNYIPTISIFLLLYILRSQSINLWILELSSVKCAQARNLSKAILLLPWLSSLILQQLVSILWHPLAILTVQPDLLDLHVLISASQALVTRRICSSSRFP